MYIVPLSALPSIQKTEEQGADTAASQQSGRSFASIIQDAITDLRQTQQAAQQDSYELAMGNVESLHNMMINAAMEATAVETAVQITARAVSAYKEIMQMQI